MSTLIKITEPGSRPGQGPAPFALWRLGFRPFYLLASVFAALSVPLWALQFSGLLPHAYLQGPLWHAHEMLFGFSLAVVVGFLLTAGRNWTGLPTPTGGRLALLAGLWLLARVLVLSPWGWAAALANTAFPLAAAAALAQPFVAARNRRNYFFIGLLVLLGLASLSLHLTQLGLIAWPQWVGIRLALDLLLFILAVMGGRVIPMFTNNGIPGTGAEKRQRLDQAALAAVLALAAADALGLQGALLAALLLGGMGLHLLRWLLWRPWKTLGTPLVWVLHAGYGWIVVHLGLRAAAALDVAPVSIADHALTVGAIGGLVIGMMTRTARGHTGRLLRADRSDVACYLLVLAAALVRVLLPWAWPQATVVAVLGSALLWSAGFGLYAVAYWPVLTRPRLDGKEG